MIIKKETISALKNGGIGVMPTDTIYGIVGSALNEKTVERIYKLRGRNKNKPMIILIGSLRDLIRFGAKTNAKTTRLLKGAGAVSVILPISASRAIRKFRYLHRGAKTLAFRLPKPYWLKRLLVKTGPLVAPSANIEGKPPAKTVAEAKRYFSAEGGSATGGKDGADFYVDGGVLRSGPSKLIKLIGSRMTILRN